MCLNSCNPPAPPAASAPAAPTVVACGTQSSEIQVLDEIGLPFGSHPVTLRLAAGGTANTSTLPDGRICLADPPGTVVDVAVADTHEAQAGDSTTTPSGRHFRLNGQGP